jgi:hypothetical protein
MSSWRGTSHNTAARMVTRGTDVRGGESRYNHRDDAQAMFDAVAGRTERVRSGKHGDSKGLT